MDGLAQCTPSAQVHLQVEKKDVLKRHVHFEFGRSCYSSDWIAEHSSSQSFVEAAERVLASARENVRARSLEQRAYRWLDLREVRFLV